MAAGQSRESFASHWSVTHLAGIALVHQSHEVDYVFATSSHPQPESTDTAGHSGHTGHRRPAHSYQRGLFYTRLAPTGSASLRPIRHSNTDGGFAAKCPPGPHSRVGRAAADAA